MWNSVNKILHREISKPLPDHTFLDTLCSSFSKFFTDKITLIRSNFVTNDNSHDFPESPHVENTIDQFTPTTTSEVGSIILKSTNASCDLDPFQTRPLKHYIDDLIVHITTIINLSMRERVVPPAFKQAIVTSLIKKKTLCRNDFKNYRPISNLSFLSKILEKIVAKRLNAHVEEQLLSNHVQSAYKRFHSTETALLKIHNDIISNMDNGKVTALTILYLSAAFDAGDHSTLLERLHGHFGISGTVTFSLVQIIHFKQTAMRSHRWLAHFHAHKIFISASRMGLSLAFSVLFIHNVNKSNNYYSRRQSSYVC